MAVEHQQHAEKTAEHRRPQQVEPEVAQQPPELMSPASLQQGMANPASVSPTTAESMQRVVGNQVTSRMIVARRQDAAVQAKLTVGAVDDEYEQEADRVANRVLQMNPDDLRRQEEEEEEELVQAQVEEEEELLQSKPLTGGARLQRQEVESSSTTNTPMDMEDREKAQLFRKEPGIPGSSQVRHMVWLKPLADSLPSLQAQEEEEELQMKSVRRDGAEEEELQSKPTLQRQEIQAKSGDGGGFTVDGDLEQRILQKKGAGRSLPADIQTDMESRFGADFSRVRLHTDSESAQVSKSLKARAFTHGHDIFFNSGETSFNSAKGKKLLAHELTHVIQQMGYGKKRRRR
jgi:hypothetical protein